MLRDIREIEEANDGLTEFRGSIALVTGTTYTVTLFSPTAAGTVLSSRQLKKVRQFPEDTIPLAVATPVWVVRYLGYWYCRPDGTGSLLGSAGSCQCVGLCWTLDAPAISNTGTVTWPATTYSLRSGGSYAGTGSINTSANATKETQQATIVVAGAPVTVSMAVAFIPAGCGDPEKAGRTLPRHTLWMVVTDPQTAGSYFEARFETCDTSCLGPLNFKLVRARHYSPTLPAPTPDLNVVWPTAALVLRRAQCHCGCFQECWFQSANGGGGTFIWQASTANQCGCQNPTVGATALNQTTATACPCDQNGCTGNYTYTAVAVGATFTWSTPAAGICSAGCSLPQPPQFDPTSAVQTYKVNCI